MMLSFDYPISTNLGDDIQTLAAMNLVGDCSFVDRDNLKNVEVGRVILNGWWTHTPESAWPPKIDCLPISMHVTEKARPYFEEHRAWFDGKSVLARDTDTNHWLQSIGVNSVFGGCLTLTLPKNEPIKREGIVFCDVPHLDYGLTPDAVVTHQTYSKDGNERRLMASELLSLYQRSRLVVTKRLHCALPCAAMGTPVVCIGSGSRYSGMERFITMSNRESVKQIVLNEYRNPTKYADAVQIYSSRLKKVVKQWM